MREIKLKKRKEEEYEIIEQRKRIVKEILPLIYKGEFKKLQRKIKHGELDFLEGMERYEGIFGNYRTSLELEGKEHLILFRFLRCLLEDGFENCRFMYRKLLLRDFRESILKKSMNSSFNYSNPTI